MEQQPALIDLYETLQVAPDASPQGIKQAYRKLALMAHPNRGGDGKEMSLIQEAYDVLSDPQKRLDYDMAQNDFYIKKGSS